MTRKKSPPESPQDAAQQVWLAGLEALSQAQAQGGRMFESLVQEGLAMQRRAESATGLRFAEVGSRVQQMGQDLGKELSERAAAPWEKIEGLFEDRVARALQRMGYPSADEVQALRERVVALERALEQALEKTPGKAPEKASRAAKSRDGT